MSQLKPYLTFGMWYLKFANNTILSCFFFLIIDLHFLIPTVIT